MLSLYLYHLLQYRPYVYSIRVPLTRIHVQLYVQNCILYLEKCTCIWSMWYVYLYHGVISLCFQDAFNHHRKRMCLPIAASVRSYVLMCYFFNTATLIKGQGKLMPAGIDPNLCTHYIYGFATIKGGELESTKDFDPKMQVGKDGKKESDCCIIKCTCHFVG